MMKTPTLPFHIPVLLLMVSTTIGTMAQPTLVSGDLAYTWGGQWPIHVSPAYAVPATGAGLTWDYADISGGFIVGIMNIVDPSTSLGAAYFPDATAMDHDPDLSDLFYASSSTEELHLGVFAPPNQRRVCTDPQTLVTYPFNYGETFTDTFLCNETGGGFDRVRTGTATVTYEGYGTVILASGTYTDCVLLTTSMQWTDETWGDPEIATGTLLTHRFYKQGIPVYLISFQAQTYYQAGQGSSSNQVFYPDLLSTAIDGAVLASSIQVRPNPAVEHFTLQRRESDPCLIELIDSQGRSVMQEQAAGTQLVVPVSGLPKGLYSLRVTTGRQTVVQRLVIGG